MVLAREFSISDSANPFYLKLRNSIPPAALGVPPTAPSIFPPRGTKEFTLATFLPRWVFSPSPSRPVLSSRSSSFPARPGGRTFLYFPAVRRAAGEKEREREGQQGTTPRPARIFHRCDIGQQKLKSSVYSYAREGNNGRSFISRDRASRKYSAAGSCTGRDNLSSVPIYPVFPRRRLILISMHVQPVARAAI